MTLHGQTAIVTGAAAGIGLAVAARLAAAGARVHCVDVSPALADAVKELSGAVPVQADLTDRAATHRLVHDIAERDGRLDVVVNVAGITQDAFLHKMTDEQWDAVLAVNLTAVFTVTRAAVQILRAQGGGRIVTISSASWLGNLGQGNYAAAKAGVVGLTLTAARELGRFGGTANVICPGFIDTAMTRAMPPDLQQAQVAKTWLGRAGEPDDVAKVVEYLAGDGAAFVTGEVVNVGGGYRI
ncbi:SDR family oxidoreductase [Jiangella asiatica]|uniref:SDR family oxidoreductase n=1 Tax=Jiangella asiatica TaxID=2530372 RepID=A0A4R5D741_9ACTN|nr:SDR family NAD(P)-dependent oxidoreductase [Jiangella asiatica]TDE09299.1 SDR family oxidoreductase [Jiangella asiatica]